VQHASYRRPVPLDDNRLLLECNSFSFRSISTKVIYPQFRAGLVGDSFISSTKRVGIYGHDRILTPHRYPIALRCRLPRRHHYRQKVGRSHPSQDSLIFIRAKLCGWRLFWYQSEKVTMAYRRFCLTNGTADVDWRISVPFRLELRKQIWGSKSVDFTLACDCESHEDQFKCKHECVCTVFCGRTFRWL
jgi:hypothetical protein